MKIDINECYVIKRLWFHSAHGIIDKKDKESSFKVQVGDRVMAVSAAFAGNNEKRFYFQMCKDKSVFITTGLNESDFNFFLEPAKKLKRKIG